MEPWAGIDAPGKEAGVIATRPWAPPENEQLRPENQKNSKHPSVVAPPRYDTNPIVALIIFSLRQFLFSREFDPSQGLRHIQPPVTSLRSFMNI
jgi:hypothetical protein